MQRHRRWLGLCASTAISAALASPALAQEAGATLDTVVVTARRMDERLQDVPISITVYNQEQLSNRNVVTGTDLATYTPSLMADSRFGPNNSNYAIRGFTQELRTSPSVAVYFADVVAPRGGVGGTPAGNGAGPGSFFDLQNVQVLKGPQGTLFGRNTTGGAILIVPQKPTREFEGYVEGSYGNYDMKRLQAVVNLPLGDTARLRLGVDRQTRDGYLKNISGVGPRRFGDIDYTAFRASFVADLTDNLENYSIFSYVKSDTNGQIPSVLGCDATGALGQLLSTLGCQPQVARRAGAGFYTVQNKMPDPESRLKQWQLINTTTWHASDNLIVKNILSYSNVKANLRMEVFGTDWILPAQIGSISTGANAGATFGFANSENAPGYLSSADQENFTEELQLQGRLADDQLIWQAGAYYEESNPLRRTGAQSPILLSCTNAATFQCTDVLAPLLRLPALGFLQYSLGETSFRNMGLYGQATYKITDQLKLTGGLRYTWDKTSGTAEQLLYRFFQPNLPTGFCALPGIVPTTVPVTDRALCTTSAIQKSDKPTWLVDLDYTPVRDVMLYAKYARGYRQGSVNIFGPIGFQSFGPEKVDTYEIGAKTSWRGEIPGSFNIAIFYNDFSNQQLSANLSSSTNAAPQGQAIVNGGKSRIKGVEFDGSVSPFRGFVVSGSYAYLDTELKSLEGTTSSVYDTIFFAALPGTRLALTPQNKYTVTASYDLPLSEEIGRVSVAATYAFTGNYVVTQSPHGRVPSFETLNLNLNWDSIGGQPVDLSLFATNVTNEKYYVNVHDQLAQGFQSYTLGEPRMYGLRLRYRFGG